MKPLLALSFTVFLASCGSPKPSGWTAEEDAQYMRECVGNGSVPGTETVCPCLMKKYKDKKMSFADTKNADKHPEFTTWYTDCMQGK